MSQTYEATINIQRPNTITVEQMQAVLNEWGPIISRSKLTGGALLDPRRDLESECGYPLLDETIEIEKYQRLYERDPIAARVVEIWPRESWQVTPSIYEDEDPEIETDFELAVKELAFSLRGEQSWRKEEEGSPLWEYMKRADELSGIGRFGILLMGYDDGDDLSRPVKGVIEKNSNPTPVGEEPSKITNKRYTLTTNIKRTTKSGKSTKSRQLIYLRAFSEYQVTVQEWEGNFSSPRYGQPVMYSIQFNMGTSSFSGSSAPTTTKDVHWTRVIHIADSHHTAPETDQIAIPRMKPVLNNILGLRKLYLGSPEMYWKGAFPGMAVNFQQGVDPTTPVDTNELKDQLERLFNGLDRYVLFRGLQPQMLSPTVVDPSSQIEVQLDGICIKITVPKRIFVGSERGEMSSAQDSVSWYNRRVPERQKNYLTPRIITPFFDRCIFTGVLPEPSEWYCWWPDITAQSELEKAQLLSARTQSMAAYSQSMIPTTLMPEKDYLTKEMGYTDDEAQALLDNVTTAKEEQQTEMMLQQEEQLAQQEEMVKRGLAPDPLDPMQSSMSASMQKQQQKGNVPPQFQQRKGKKPFPAKKNGKKLFPAKKNGKQLPPFMRK